MYICIYVYVCAIATCVNVRGCYRSLLYHGGHEEEALVVRLGGSAFTPELSYHHPYLLLQIHL